MQEEIPKIALGQRAFLRKSVSANAASIGRAQISGEGNPENKTFRVYLLFRRTPRCASGSLSKSISDFVKPDAPVVPAEAIVDGADDVVVADRTSRVASPPGSRRAPGRGVRRPRRGAMVTRLHEPDCGTERRPRRLLPDTTTRANPGDGPTGPSMKRCPAASAAPFVQLQERRFRTRTG